MHLLGLPLDKVASRHGMGWTMGPPPWVSYLHARHLRRLLRCQHFRVADPRKRRQVKKEEQKGTIQKQISTKLGTAVHVFMSVYYKIYVYN